MAIRDRVRRALRKSDSSDCISQTESNTSNTSDTSNTTAATSSETSSLHKSTTTSSTLSKVFSFGSRDSKDKELKRARGGRRKPVHPSQRPLTLQNLKHQEMLSHFTMTFGASNPDQIERLSFCGVSPCCTRAGSVVDFDGGDVSSPSSLSVAEMPRSLSARQ